MATARKKKKRTVRARRRYYNEDLDDEEDDDENDDEEQAEAGNALTRFLFRPRILLILAIVVGGLVGLPHLKKHLPELRGRAEYSIDVANITIPPAPRWVPRNVAEQAVLDAKLVFPMSRLDKGLVPTIAQALRQHPWVKRVTSARLDASGVVVELEYRRASAMIHVPQGMYPVDAEGTLLPPGDFSSEDVAHFPIVENVKSVPQGPAGTPWGDDGVTGAAQLAEVLAPHWKKFNLVAIRVPDRTNALVTPDEIIYEILTGGGSQIVWGRAPSSRHPGELTVAQKIGRLEDYQAKYGRFDQPQGPYRIEIHHWREISRRRLSNAGDIPSRRR